MLSMSAIPGGFRVTYTEPLSGATAESLASRYRIRQWGYAPKDEYGGPKVNEETLRVTSATLSGDGTTVDLQIAGLKPDRVVYLRSPRPFSSEAGRPLWSTEAWYTLNALPGAQPGTAHEAESATLTGGAVVDTEHEGYSGSGFVEGYWNQGASTAFAVDAAAAGPHRVTLRYGNGPNPFSGTKTVSLYVNGSRVRQVSLPSTGTWTNWQDHVEDVTLAAGRNTIAFTYDPADSGNVNLDRIDVARTGGEGSPRVTLFDGADLDAWESTDGGPPTWPITDGTLESYGGDPPRDIRTKQWFGDFRLHVEFRIPNLPPGQTGQNRGNSGIYLHDRYELQILDSFGVENPGSDQLGGIYQKCAPSENAALPAGQWQTYDIDFRGARWNGTTKTENARVTVRLNGTSVLDGCEIDGSTGGGAPEAPVGGPIRLQDHGDPNENPRFRNIWLEPTG